MSQASSKKKYFLILLLLLAPALILLYLARADHNFSYLPVYGEKFVEYNTVDGMEVADTVYHTIPHFSFIDQDSNVVTLPDFDNKILIADFFFTSCPSICPIMTKQMARLQWILDDAAYKDVHFLSHTVDPTHDTPSVLKAYGEEQGADFNRWTFVTGEKEAIYEQGFQGYLLNTQEDDMAPGGFLHSQMFVLVDRDRRIRGFYDGTNTQEVDNLVDDVKMLLKEEKIRERDAGK